MSIALGTLGIWQFTVKATPELAVEAERLGYGTVWIGGSPDGSLDQAEALLDATERITVATGIVNMWKDDAATVAASYHRLEGKHPGRFLLGVGIGHREQTQEYRSPYDKIVEYLDQLDDAGVPPGRRVLAALGARVLELSAARAAGAHPYLTTPDHTASARKVLGPDALLAPEHKVVVDPDAERARAIGRKVVKRYLGLVNYRQNLLRFGFSEDDLAGEGSDRLVDALALHGDAETVARGLRAHLEAGADHISIQVLGGDLVPAYRALAEALQ
ncbi:MAG TPA: LLM class F420-dependent oxidoreductase [Acidimicrobiia bacterium]|jgi:probable F420-dependent oxidoreductase|nr:LLM class F420-dependent oxidoreductase [Acidimicrobiia bacterium]